MNYKIFDEGILIRRSFNGETIQIFGRYQMRILDAEIFLMNIDFSDNFYILEFDVYNKIIGHFTF